MRPFPRWQLPWRLVQLFLGTHARARPVTLFSGRRLELEAAGDLPPLDLDGDPYRATAAEVRVLPGALKMIRPSA